MCKYEDESRGNHVSGVSLSHELLNLDELADYLAKIVMILLSFLSVIFPDKVSLKHS